MSILSCRDSRSATPEISEGRKLRSLLARLTVNIANLVTHTTVDQTNNTKKKSNFDTYYFQICGAYSREGEGEAAREGPEVECSRISSRMQGLGGEEMWKEREKISRSQASLLKHVA